MGVALIGIKLADGKFYAVLDENSPSSRSLEISTVRDNQTSVQINLFRAERDDDFYVDEDPSIKYVGTLIIEDIAEKPAGEPTIALSLTLNESNELSAEAVDVESGVRQVLNVSLETLEEPNIYSLPDFDLMPTDKESFLGEDPNRQNVLIEGEAQGIAPEGLFTMEKEEKRNGIFLPAWLCVLILAVGVIALVLAMIVYARVLVTSSSSASNQKVVAPPIIETPLVPSIEPEPLSEPASDLVTPPPVVETEQTEVAVVQEPVVPEQPKPVETAKDIRYKIKWGDTLWDIADSYYRNPWLYPKIAKHNNIKNPNLIISGTYINIPAK